MTENESVHMKHNFRLPHPQSIRISLSFMQKYRIIIREYYKVELRLGWILAIVTAGEID